MNDVTHTITDGLMGFNNASAEGIHIKIGASPMEGDPVIITSSRKLEYIRENSQEKLRLLDVADQVYVSQWHLSKLLNKHTGKTFSDILNSTRIDKAKELLKDPSLRIYDVAEIVGFQDLAHFSRVFKKIEGMSANEYRNTINTL